MSHGVPETNFNQDYLLMECGSGWIMANVQMHVYLMNHMTQKRKKLFMEILKSKKWDINVKRNMVEGICYILAGCNHHGSKCCRHVRRSSNVRKKKSETTTVTNSSVWKKLPHARVHECGRLADKGLTGAQSTGQPRWRKSGFEIVWKAFLW